MLIFIDVRGNVGGMAFYLKRNILPVNQVSVRVFGFVEVSVPLFDFVMKLFDSSLDLLIMI